MPTKEDLLNHYKLQPPDAIGIEEIDGTFYPKDIPEPDIAFVPLAEPHVVITDLYEDPQDWYYIRELIEEFGFQSFTAYYGGLYFASYTLSTSCLELTLKYELVRNGIIESAELEKSSCNFFWAIKQIKDINLEKYESRLNIVHKMRNGMFHFNPKKLNESLISIQNETIPPETEIFIGGLDKLLKAQSSDFPWSISEYVDNKEWSKVAFFTYMLMYDITKQLYGIDQEIAYFKEGMEDYDQKEQTREKARNQKIEKK